MEGGIREQGDEGEPREDKLMVSGAEGEVFFYLCEVSNGRFSFVCEMQEMDPRKMRESKDGDLEIGESFNVWKMREAS